MIDFLLTTIEYAGLFLIGTAWILAIGYAWLKIADWLEITMLLRDKDPLIMQYVAFILYAALAFGFTLATLEAV